MKMKINLLHGDCLDLMKSIPDKSIDMVLTDPPYGTTACKWDVVIPFEPMWTELKRITKDNGAICLFGSEPFSSHLRMSNLKMFKYDWVWSKNNASGFATAKIMPMKSHELIHVFGLGKIKYNPVLVKSNIKDRKLGVLNNKKRTNKKADVYSNIKPSGEDVYLKDMVNPRTVVEFNVVVRSKGTVHPTQKPVALLEYLIKTYTLEGETVLDFTMGSGSTGVACKNLNRNFIGIEKEEKYFEIAKQRIND